MSTPDALTKHLEYFLDEIAYVQREGEAFARRFPTVAGALDFGGHGSADPHVQRLIEAFAFISGRLQRNLDQQVPRLALPVLETLYPALTSPVPSMVMAESGSSGSSHSFAITSQASRISSTIM